MMKTHDIKDIGLVVVNLYQFEKTVAKAGYTNISSMNGGIQDWISAGYPTTSGQ